MAKAVPTDPSVPTIKRLFRVRRRQRNRIEFMIAHHRFGRAGLHHVHHGTAAADVVLSAVDKITDEHREAFGMGPRAVLPRVTKLLE